MDKNTIILIDAYSQIFRAFYAIADLTNTKGVPTNALFGFVKILLKLEKEFPSDYGAVVFDCGRVNFRMELNPDYKANRKPTPDALKIQVPYIREFIEAFGWTILEEPEFEADDLIAAIAVNCQNPVKFLSSDKDLSQLINNRITQLVPDQKSTLQERDVDKATEKFGVTPDLIVDYLTLLGDNADNIPGVPGIGEKTAVKILNQFGALKELIENPEKIFDDKLKKKLLDNQELIKRNLQLIKLRTDLPGRLSDLTKICKKNPPDFKRIEALLKELELHSLENEINKLKTQPSSAASMEQGMLF